MLKTDKQILDETWESSAECSLIYRLMKRAKIRRNDTSRKSVQQGKPDRISELLEEAALELYRKDLSVKFLAVLVGERTLSIGNKE